MKVSVKDLNITMDLGNKGLELDVYDASDTHLGDLHIGKAKLEWCRGKTRSGNGVQVGWPELIAWFESQKK